MFLRARASPPRPRLLSAASHVAVGATAVLALTQFLARGGDFADRRRAPSKFTEVTSMGADDRALCGPPTVNGEVVTVDVQYTAELRPWLERAAEGYMARCPGVQLRLAAGDELAGGDALVRGQARPTLWIAAHDLALAHLDARWRRRHGTPLPGLDGATSLARSPLVLLGRDDRLSALGSPGADSPGLWTRAVCAGVPRDPSLAGRELASMVPGTWSEVQGGAGPLAGAPAWPGSVRLTHASPTRSAAGLSALYLMARDHALPRDQGAVADAFELAFERDRSAFARWLRRCEAGLPPAIASAARLTSRLFEFGGARLDGVFTPEHLAVAVLDELDAHELPPLRVIYPEPTFVSRYPAAVLWPDDPTRSDQVAAGRRWLAYLRGDEMQRAAVELGLRPADPARARGDLDPTSDPFIRLRRRGLDARELLDAPPIAGELVDELLAVWQAATGSQ